MKNLKSLVAVVAVVVAAGARVAQADTGAPEIPSNVHTVTEQEDAWLHEHCSFRNVVAAKHVHANARRVLTLQMIQMGADVHVKVFACAERPPFVPETSFTPATAAEVACEDEEAKQHICAKPLAAASTPSDVAASATSARRVEPSAGDAPRMPEPTPPRVSSAPASSAPASRAAASGWRPKKRRVTLR